jgi:hypothetical protein
MQRPIRSGLLAIILMGGAGIAFAQSAADLLIQAYDAFEVNSYQDSKQLSGRYLSTYGQSFKPAYLHAMSLCQLGDYGSGRAELNALTERYLLSAKTASQVSSWVESCPPPKVVSNEEDEPDGIAHSHSSGLTVVPSFDAAALTAPTPMLSRMGPLLQNTSFSGEDYDLVRASNAANCVQICRSQSACRSMTFAPSSGACWLKRSVPPARSGAGWVSAAKVEPSTAPPIPSPRMSPLVGAISYSGGDYAAVSAASPGACAEMCRTQAQCRSMTYAPSSQKCWLKQSVPPAMQGEGFYSSIKVP